MATYLLTWNPEESGNWDELPDRTEWVKAGNPLEMRWSCGVTKRIQRGDQVFLLRQGKEPKGIFASGTVTKGSYEDKHWNSKKSEAGKKALYVKAVYDVLLDPHQDTILSREQLDKPPFQGMHWDTQSSSISIPDNIAAELEKTLAKLAGIENFQLAEEGLDTDTLYEGVKRWVSVNTYERNPKARKKCIAHYGATCSICGIKFGEKYGKAGEGFIHVHHLTPLSEVSEKYEVDPINDLRPVCPNCHAIIHLRKPPYSIKEVKDFLRQAKAKKKF